MTGKYYRRYFEEHTAIDESAILQALPSQLRTEVAVFLVDDVVFENDFFGPIDTPTLAILVSRMKPLWFSSGDFLTQHDFQGRSLFLIVSGEALEYDREGVPLTRLLSGTVLGHRAALDISDACMTLCPLPPYAAHLPPTGLTIRFPSVLVACPGRR